MTYVTNDDDAKIRLIYNDDEIVEFTLEKYYLVRINVLYHTITYDFLFL